MDGCDAIDSNRTDKDVGCVRAKRVMELVPCTRLSLQVKCQTNGLGIGLAPNSGFGKMWQLFATGGGVIWKILVGWGFSCLA